MLYIRTYSRVVLAPTRHTQKALRNVLSEPLTRESAEQSSLLAEVEQLCLSARQCSKALDWISLFLLRVIYLRVKIKTRNECVILL